MTQTKKQYQVSVYNEYTEHYSAYVMESHSLLRTVLCAELLSTPKDVREKPDAVYDMGMCADELLKSPAGPLGGDLVLTVFCQGMCLINGNAFTPDYTPDC